MRKERDKRVRLLDEKSSFDDLLAQKKIIFYCQASFSNSLMKDREYS